MEAKVVTTFLLVSLSISMILSTPYWMGGFTGQYTRFEIIQILSAYCSHKSAYHDFNGTDADSWEINLLVKNAGTREASIIRVFVNGRPISSYGSGDTTDWIVTFAGGVSGSPIDFEGNGKITIEPGSTKEVIILIAEDSEGAYAFARSGVSIEVSLQTGGGSKYMKMLTLT